MNFNIKPKFTLDRFFLADTFSYSAGNYIASIFSTAPNFILPIMVLNILGPKTSAYYYIAYLITGFLFMVPNAISMSLFVEGSHGGAFKKAAIKSIVAMLVFLTPISLILYVFAGFLLGLVGAEYASEGIELFRIMIIASFFVSFNYISSSIQRVQRDIRGIIFISGLVFVLILGLGYLFSIKYGVIGIGYAWLVSYFVGSMFFIMIIYSNKLIK
jgi:O-antigen/teichoic acid export membrane protein